MKEPEIHQISISDGGVPKLPVDSAAVTAMGLEGDRHNDTEIHGGPTRALCSRHAWRGQVAYASQF